MQYETLACSRMLMFIRFAEPDSGDNIMFEEEQRDNQVLIKAGNIYKLVERLTFHEYAGTVCKYKTLYRGIHTCTCIM